MASSALSTAKNAFINFFFATLYKPLIFVLQMPIFKQLFNSLRLSPDIFKVRQKLMTFNGSYADAFNISKSNNFLLIVCLYSDFHEFSRYYFEHNVLAEEFVGTIRKHNVVFWLGDVQQDKDAAILFSNLHVKSLPFMAFLGKNSEDKMVVYSKLNGLFTQKALLCELKGALRAMTEYTLEFKTASETRNLLQQQESAYLASLAADKKKEEQKQSQISLQKQQQELIEAEERKRQAAIEKRKSDLEAIVLPDEPSVSAADVCKISIRLPNGDRLLRRFNKTDIVKDVYNFVKVHYDTLDDSYVLCNTFPKTQIVDRAKTLEESGLCPSSSLLIEYF